MRKITKNLAILLCLMICVMVSMSGCLSTESDTTKDIVGASGKDEDGKASKEPISVSIEEQVLVNQDGIVVTAQKYVKDDFWGDGIKLQIENNSDKDVTVSCDALIVNDYMTSDLFAVDVAAGKKTNETLYLLSEELENAGIDTVGKVEIYFNVYDSSSYDTIFKTDCITINTSAFANMDTTPKDAGKELYNEGGIRIVGKTVDENSFWGASILLYCENTSGRNVVISIKDMSINGFMMDPLFASTVYNGKKAIESVTLFSSDLEKNGITSIQDVELKFHIYDAENYDTIVDSDVIKFSAE